MSSITDENRKHLRRPFTPEAVKFRIDGKPKNGKVRCLTYIDSRLASERLTEVDPDWRAVYHFPISGPGDLGMGQNLPVVCSLAVKGVVREGAGQRGNGTVDDKHFKSAVSDALKRAAVDFGVGAYLYTLGNTFLTVGDHTDGQGKYINAKGQKYLREQYKKAISAKSFVERFGEPVDYGDVAPVEVEEVPSDDGLAPEQAKQLKDLCLATGASETEADTLVMNTKPDKFARRVKALEKRIKEQKAGAEGESSAGSSNAETGSPEPASTSAASPNTTSEVY